MIDVVDLYEQLDNPLFRWILDHVWWFIGFYCLLPVFAYFILPFFATKRPIRKRPTVLIIVLGDLGHLPRMCYHASSFSKLDYFVNLCGYIELTPPEFVVDDCHIDIHEIRPVVNRSKLPFVLFALNKMVVQLKQLLLLLFLLEGLDYFVIQNPPLIPIVALTVLYIRLFSRHSKLVIDWHNLNWSILNMRYQNTRHPLVRVLKGYERWVVAHFGDIHITVTQLMKQELVKSFDVPPNTVYVLYDRPAQQMSPVTDQAVVRQKLFNKYKIDAPEGAKLVVSLTSFTPDEDFNVLLDALEELRDDDTLPPLVVVVTGKGPMKNEFLLRVKELKFNPKRIIVDLVWLLSHDYPLMMAAADLGISLHTSLSGVDLPMKILDMFGGGTPVISLDFPAISELVKEGNNGLITTPAQMAINIQTALTDKEIYQQIKKGAMEESENKWDANWKQVLWPVFNY